MKKLFVFLGMFCVAMSSWAYNVEGPRPGHDVVKITGELTASDIATIISNTIENYQPKPQHFVLDFTDATLADGVTTDAFFVLSYEDQWDSNVNQMITITKYTPLWASNQMMIFPRTAIPTKAQVGSVQSFQYYPGYSMGYWDEQKPNFLNVAVPYDNEHNGPQNFERLKFVLNENNGVYFLPIYYIDGSYQRHWSMVTNSQQTPVFDKLKHLEVGCFDFSMVSTNMPTDFTNNKLNAKTHFITLPINGTDWDIMDGTVYKYPNTIYAVSTYKRPSNGTTQYATSCTIDGIDFTATEPTNLTYVTSNGVGKLDDAGFCNFLSSDQISATRQNFYGSMNATDLAELSTLSSPKFDFNRITIASEDMVTFSNSNVQYLALPGSAASTIAGTENACAYSTSTKCPYLYCVGALNTETHKYTTWSKQNLNNGVQVPSVYQVSLMYPASEISAITDVDMSGYLCRNDITVGVDESVDNRSEIASVIGLSGANAIETADFGDAVFMPNSDMRFVGIYSEGRAGWSGTALISITFPTSESQEEIPSYCLVGGSDSQPIEIHIPSNYKTIGDYAFYGRYATKITTIDSEGNVVDNGEYTISLPASLESIGTGAFVLNHELITDVYVLAKTAPTCAPDAFNTGAYCGYGGFAGNYAHPISRDTYINNGTRFAILHFPSDVEVGEAENYTDITREYSLMDETGAYDGEGKLKAWPNFSEIYRAYHQAVDGAIWKTDGWDTTRGTGWTTDEQGNTSSNGRNFNDIACWPATYLDANGNEVSVTNLYDASTMMSSATVTPGNAYDTRYMGWHQFVLADYYRYTTPTPPATGAKYVDAGWYTLCIPYDLTEAQVINLIGAPASGKYKGNAPSKNSAGDHFPVVYALKTVTRQDPTVTLGFSQELMGTIYNGQDLKFNDNGTISIEDYNYDAPSGKEEKIYIKGGYSYLVRPIVPEGTTIGNNLGQWMLKNSSFTKSELGNRLELGNDNSVAIPIQKHKVIATDPQGNQLTYIDDNNVEQPYYYYFQGTYTTEKMPTAYFLTDLWYRQTEPDVRNWDNYTAIIAGKSTANGATPVTKTPAEFTAAKDLTTYFIKMVCGRDHFHWKGGNVKIKVTFEDENGFDQALAIDQIDGKDLNTVTEGTVYNMAGQKVGSSLNSLAKGLYIVNGKKVMVK